MYPSLSTGTLKNHRNSKVDFLCVLPLSLGRPSITIAVEWPLKPNSINLVSSLRRFKEYYVYNMHSQNIRFEANVQRQYHIKNNFIFQE